MNFFKVFLFALVLLSTASNGIFAQNCCIPPLNPVYDPIPGECGSFTICLEDIDDSCIIENIITPYGLSDVYWPRVENCITVSGYAEGDELYFALQIHIQGCNGYFDFFKYEVECEDVDCCDEPIAYEITNENCASFDVCLLDLEDCTINEISAPNGTYTPNESCVTISTENANVGDILDFDLEVQIEGCGGITIPNIEYVVTETCDPCCAPPNIDDVTFDPIPGWPWLRICIPALEAQCLDSDQSYGPYRMRWLQTCRENPGIYLVTNSRSNCFYFRYDECCDYEFQVGYDLEVCDPVQFSEPYIFDPNPECRPIGSSNDIVSNKNTTQINSVHSNDLVVLPNPFKENFQILLSTEREEQYQLAIYDIQGKVVFEQNGKLMIGANNISVNQLNGFPSGEYYYQLITESKRFSNKLVKY